MPTGLLTKVGVQQFSFGEGSSKKGLSDILVIYGIWLHTYRELNGLSFSPLHMQFTLPAYVLRTDYNVGAVPNSNE